MSFNFTILAIIDKKNKETNEKSVTLVRTEESAEAVIQGCFVKKGILKNLSNSLVGKHLCWSLF